MLVASLGYAVVYAVVGLLLLALGFAALDAVTPGRLGTHILEARSVNAAMVASAGLIGLALVVFTAIWTNATSGFGHALVWTIAFGLLGVLMQVVAFLVLDLATPGRLGDVVVQVPFHPAALLAASAQLAVAGIIVASIA